MKFVRKLAMNLMTRIFGEYGYIICNEWDMSGFTVFYCGPRFLTFIEGALLYDGMKFTRNIEEATILFRPGAERMARILQREADANTGNTLNLAGAPIGSDKVFVVTRAQAVAMAMRFTDG